ncbi:MAG: AAA family ATPase [Pseudomonadales bacterium]|nr:AAA family ATPase [Pseudomonadales bacterium]
MTKVLVVGNSGSGKTTLARRLQQTLGLAHLDLDTLAWMPGMPPQRRPLEDSAAQIAEFLQTQQGWVVEGCYADLLALLEEEAEHLVFLQVSEQECVANARNRPFEPHKYSSRAAQDRNLEMLIQWIGDYGNRTDSCSLSAHEALYQAFTGRRHRLTSTLQADCWLPP